MPGSDRSAGEGLHACTSGLARRLTLSTVALAGHGGDGSLVVTGGVGLVVVLGLPRQPDYSERNERNEQDRCLLTAGAVEPARPARHPEDGTGRLCDTTRPKVTKPPVERLPVPAVRDPVRVMDDPSAAIVGHERRLRAVIGTGRGTAPIRYMISSPITAARRYAASVIHCHRVVEPPYGAANSTWTPSRYPRWLVMIHQ